VSGQGGVDPARERLSTGETDDQRDAETTRATADTLGSPPLASSEVRLTKME